MTNLLISNNCNLACPYCFAGLSRNSDERKYISSEDYIDMMDYLDRSGIHEARLLGGEPTMHPQFGELVKLAMDRGKAIVVFSNGIIPKRSLEALLSIPVHQCSILVNVNASKEGTKDYVIIKTRNRNISILGERCILGYTIDRKDCNLDELIRLINDTGCKRGIRLGIAQPVINGETIIHPKDYQIISRKITQFAQKAAMAQVKIEFDCGFVRCMFSDEDCRILRECGVSLDFKCSPIIDIDLNGNAFPCFPLKSTGEIKDAVKKSSSEIYNEFQENLKAYRTAGIFPECSDCLYKQRGVCSGGCLATTINRFQKKKCKNETPDGVLTKSFQEY